MTAPLVFSIRPRYVAALLAGTKTVEFRTRRPSVERGDTILIYETAPRSRVVATAAVQGLLVGTPAEVWARSLGRGGIDRAAYDRYFDGRALAVGIELVVTPLAEPVPLPEGQRAPQSWARWRGAWPLSEPARLCRCGSGLDPCSVCGKPFCEICDGAVCRGCLNRTMAGKR